MLLKVGSRGEDVKAVQEFLGLGADGIFGKGTEQAVKDFQSLNGLDADGLVGKGTWAAMGLNDTDATGQEESDAPDIYSKNKVTKGDLEYVEYFMPEDEYKHGPVNYEYLFLHHTAGWHNPYKCVEYWDSDGGTIATEWVMGGPSVKGNDERYDGELLQCFPEGNYAWHLGKNGSQHMHVHSVGIEICNFGYVVDGKTYAGTQVADSQIVTLKEEFRGHKTWHRYSDKQIEQLEKWMKFIGERDGIDIRAGLPSLIKEKGVAAFEFNEDAYYGKVKGTWTHTNTRKDKFDLFPQQELMDMLVSL
jgi:hypothetical protein